MSPQLIELSLSHSPARRRAEILLALGDHLLRLMSEHAPEDTSLKAHVFRESVHGWRQELSEEDHPDRYARLITHISAECDAFLDRVQTYRADREAEFVDLVNVLREVIDTVRGDSLQFEHELIRSTTEMGRLVEIEDIRELKRALASQVHTLREAVAERQSNEATHYEQLATRVQTLERTLVKAKAEAAIDALTQLPNRGTFDHAIRDWMTRAARDRTPFTLAMIDLDDFKRINDSHGHPVGDRVITAAAQLLMSELKDGEFVSRFGGEEFAALLTSPTAGKARERLCALLAHLPPAYEYEQGGEKRFVTFTFSAGVTEYVSGDTADSLVKRADEALYDAKRRGKNRVETRSRSFLRALMG